MNQYYIYVLLCQNSNYYVGTATKPRNRIKEHFQKRTYKKILWLDQHRVEEVILVVPAGNKETYNKYEDCLCAIIMELIGVNRARGGIFTSTMTDQQCKDLLEKKDFNFDPSWKSALQTILSSIDLNTLKWTKPEPDPVNRRLFDDLGNL